MIVIPNSSLETGNLVAVAPGRFGLKAAISICAWKEADGKPPINVHARHRSLREGST